MKSNLNFKSGVSFQGSDVMTSHYWRHYLLCDLMKMENDTSVSNFITSDILSMLS